MNATGTYEMKGFRNMSDDEISNAVISAILDIRKSNNKYGEIIITVSGGNVKHIDVRKPWESHTIACLDN